MFKTQYSNLPQYNSPLIQKSKIKDILFAALLRLKLL